MSVGQIIAQLLGLLAGIGVFLIAIKLIGGYLESIGGNRLKQLFAKTSKSNALGVGIGATATALIQSSGATSVMVIGFVNAGLMSVMQGSAIVLGANLGTTITGQIVAIGLLGGGSSAVSATIIFTALAGVGAFILYFGKKDSTKKIGGMIASFGLLFVGLSTMSNSMKVFSEQESIRSFIASINFPGYSVVLVFIGIILTAIIQSSSVTSSIAITMLVSNLISLDQGIFLMLGSNIGAVVVALLACIGTDTNAKRIAVFHLITNIVRVFLFLAVVEIITAATGGWLTMGWVFERMFPTDALIPLRLSMFHTLFNALTVALFTPLIKPFVKLTEKLVPERKSKNKEMSPEHLNYIDDHFLKTPPIAVVQVKNEIVGMAEVAMENFNLALDTVCTLDFDKADHFRKNEEHLNYLNSAITSFVVKLSKTDLSEIDNVYISTVFHSISDLERIGDYAENIMEYAEKLQSVNKGFSDDAIDEIRELQALIGQLYERVMKVYVNHDVESFKDAYQIEDKVDLLTEQMSDRHIARLDQGICSPDIGAPYLSLASNAERVADHFLNVANSILSYMKNANTTKTALENIKFNDKKELKSAEESAMFFQNAEITPIEELINGENE